MLGFFALLMLGRFLSSLTYFTHRKGCPALCLVIEAMPLVCHTISGSQGCLAWEKLHGHVPKSALHALLFLLSLIRVHTMKTTAAASFSSPSVLSLFFFRLVSMKTLNYFITLHPPVWPVLKTVSRYHDNISIKQFSCITI